MSAGLLKVNKSAQNLDANNIKENSLLRLGTASTNAPERVANRGAYILTLFYSNTYITQVIFIRTDKIYMRDNSTEGWSEWKPLAFE